MAPVSTKQLVRRFSELFVRGLRPSEGERRPAGTRGRAARR